MKIAIVNSSSFGKYFPEHIERLSAVGEVKSFTFPVDIDGPSLAEALMGYPIIIASVKPSFNREFFDRKDETRLISRHGIGYDNVDVTAASEKGCILSRVAGWVEREAVAETAVTLLLDILRRTGDAARKVKESRWAERASFVGWEIKDKTVGIIGIGNIGSRVCEILRYGFNARVVAYDPNLAPDVIRSRGAEPVELDYLLEHSDIISLNASLNPGSYHMLSTREFGLMKQGIYIVNTARGELFDQDALISAIESGKVAGVGMDVVEGEPIDGSHPLLKYDNVLIVPHIAAYTMESLRLMGEKVVEDVERVIHGEMPDEVINPDVIRLRGIS
ncbi:MAG: D-isomer specific 2-hydroxyacid dehydrogenase family protein [Armatimonadota bacterium]